MKSIRPSLKSIKKSEGNRKCRMLRNKKIMDRDRLRYPAALIITKHNRDAPLPDVNRVCALLPIALHASGLFLYVTFSSLLYVP